MFADFSASAWDDMLEISGFLAEGSSQAGAKFIERLQQLIDQILLFPEAVPVRADLEDGIRLRHFGPWVVAYRIHPDLIEIIRILSARRDLRAALREP